MITGRQLRAVQKTALGIAAQAGALAEMIDALLGAAAEEERVQGPSCPRCGSPKYSDLSGMGSDREYQCVDCGMHYAP